MNISFKPIIIAILLILAVFFVGGFLNDAFKGNSNSSLNVQSQEGEIIKNLDNIGKIEGQKITAIKGTVVTLENGESIDFGANEIKCQVGDIIENYTVANQSLVCVRKDANGNVLNSIIMPLAAGIGGGILGNYIASKLFANNNGINRMPNSYDYRGNNGTVFGSQFTQSTSASSGTNNRNNTSRSYRSSSGFGGLFGGFGGGSTDSNSGTNNTGSKSGSTSGSKGGVSTGSKGGGLG
jgi:hypothetical protein